MTLAKLELYGIILLLLILSAIGAGAYERHVGYTERGNEDAAAAFQQREQFDRDKAVADKRAKDAEDVLKSERAANAAQRASLPTTHVVCRASNPEPVPPGKGAQAPGVAGAGTLPQGGSQDFDPGPRLDALHDEADDIVAQCRALDADLKH
jgi:hypothetical protein